MEDYLMTPQLRFPEFTDAWQVKRFGDVVKLRKNKFDPQKSIESRKDVELDNLATETGGILGYIDSRTQMSIKNVFQKDDILYGKLRPYLKKFAKAPWGGVSSSEIWAMYSDEIYSDYLLHLIQTKTFNDSVNIQSGSKMPRADWGLVSDTEYDMPSKPEQEKIADFLTAVDERIRLGEQKLAKLEQYKRGVMQKIFSQQIRFKDENGNEYTEWGKKKLGSIVKEVNEKTDESNKYETLSSTTKGLFSQREYFNKNIASEDNSGYKILRINQVVFSPQNLWMGNINYNDRFEEGIVSPSYKIFKPVNVVEDFLKQILKTNRMLYEYTQASEQGASIVRRNLDISSFLNIRILLPSLEEQQKIAIFLATLDDKITAEKSKLTAAKKWKKGLLQRMFV